VQGPVRLALAWYPGMLREDEAGQPLSQPRLIVTDGPAYTAPAPFRFEVLSPPPAEALMPLPSGFQGRGALGLLLAYTDGNANTRLDTIPREGSPVDHVLGSSLEWTTSPAFLIVYVDSAQPEATGLRKGFNLVKLTDEQAYSVVPSSTPIPLALSGGPHLDLFVCEAAWTGSQGEAPCGLDLGTEQPTGEFSLAGTVHLYTGLLQVDLTVALEGKPLNDAVITLGGTRIPFDAQTGQYQAHSLDPALLARAQGAELRISAQGQELRRTLTASGSFEIQGPLRARSGAPFTTRWSASAGAQAYNVSLDNGVHHNLGFAVGLDTTEHTFGALAYSGTAVLRVEAVSWLDDGRSGPLELKVIRTQPLLLEPAQEAPRGPLDVLGRVNLTRYGTETIIVVTRGLEIVTDAQVMLGNTQLPYDPDTGSHMLVETFLGSIFDQGPVELRVLSQGQELRRTLTAPALFDVLTPTLPANPRSGAPLTVSWESSTGAEEYSVMIVAAGPGIIADELTSDLQTTFTPAAYEGLATLYVRAVTFVPGSEAGGGIELRRENTVPLRFEP
jgi:hypothetical protein